MKKWFAIALAMILALAIPAHAATGDAILGVDEDGNQEYFRYGFIVGDTLFLSSYGSLYTYHIGDEAIREYPFAMPEGDEGIGDDIQYLPFASGDKLYTVALFNTYTEFNHFEGAKLYTMTLDDEAGAVLEEQQELDWSELVEYYDESSYASYPEGVAVIGGKVLLRTYDTNGNYIVYALDVATGSITQVDALTDVMCMVPYKDDLLLIQQYSYGQSDKIRMQAYDVESESLQPIGEFEPINYGPVEGLAYDPEQDAAYCVRGGEICPLDLTTGEIGEGIADMPPSVYVGSGNGCVMPGGYYAFVGSGAVVRSLHPDNQAATKLKISDTSWSNGVNDAYNRFVNARGDVRVILTHDDNGSIIESMMNRDSSIDIYVMSTSNPEYEAVYNRGYMLELDDCEKTRAFVEGAYPALGEALTYKGHVVALPVEVYGYCLGVNEKALNSIGLQVSDVPTNWMDFLDFVETLPERLGEDSKVVPFYSWATIEDLKMQLFYMIFDDYQKYVNATDPAMGYNTPLLRGLLARLDAVDFEAMGYEHQEETDDEQMYAYDSAYNEDEVELFSFGVGCTFGCFYGGDFVPVLMSMDADTPAILTMETMVAFVNPFTQNPEAAMAFMEQLTDCLPDSVRYSFDPNLNEPIRGKYNAQNLQEIDNELADMRTRLETATPEEKQDLEELIRQWEEYRQNLDEYGWDIAQRDIDWYRAHDDHLIISKANWLYSEGSGEAWDLMSQYQAGQISGEEMLIGIDKKVQMMLMEGN